MSETISAPSERQILGHPRGLATLFFTEMWERFSFYGMRALLVLFMTTQVVDGGLEPDLLMKPLQSNKMKLLYLAGWPFRLKRHEIKPMSWFRLILECKNW